MEILRATAYFQIVINIPYLYYFVYITNVSSSPGSRNKEFIIKRSIPASKNYTIEFLHVYKTFVKKMKQSVYFDMNCRYELYILSEN